MESKVQNLVKRRFEKKGFKVIKIIQLSENGYPDLMCLKEGNAVFVEVKDKGEKPRKLQIHRMRELVKMGFVAMWTDDAKEYHLP